jgi:ferredoxin
MNETVAAAGSLRVIVDRSRCIGSGMCTSIAPEVFDLDDEGNLVVLLPLASTTDQIAAVRDATACCPVEAISLALSAED